MFNSTWWLDQRYAHERRMVAKIGALGGTALLFVAVLAYATQLRLNKKESMNLTQNQVPAATSTASTPVVTGILEQAAEQISSGRTAEGEVSLRQAGLLLARLEGILAWKNGDLPLASASFERALAMDANSVPDLVNLAGVALNQNHAARAVELLTRARNLAMDDPYIANRLLLARLQAGDVAGVRAEVQGVLQSNPENGLPTVAVAAAALELAAHQPRNAANFLYAASSVLPQTIFKSLLEEPPLSAHAHREELKPFYPASNLPPTP